jgi:hypothetical protein
VSLTPGEAGGTVCTYHGEGTPVGAEEEYTHVTRAMHDRLAGAMADG